MKTAEAAWVRAHAWPPRSRRRGNYPVRPDTCSCTWGVCNNCTRGAHHNCVTSDGRPAPDRYVAPLLGWDGWRVAAVVFLPGQRPCSLLCPCPHPSHATPAASAAAPAVPRPAQGRRSTKTIPGRQLGLFEEATA